VDTGEQQVSVAAEGCGPYTQALGLQKGDNTRNITLEDGTVAGVLRENAVVNKPIKKAEVTIAGVSAQPDGSRFLAESVPVGTQTVTVTAPGHAPYKDTVQITPGDNTLEVTLDLTPGGDVHEVLPQQPF
jgi:hypothetical protein